MLDFVIDHIKRDSPVTADRYAPRARAITFQPMKAITGQIHIGCRSRTIEHVQLPQQNERQVQESRRAVRPFQRAASVLYGESSLSRELIVTWRVTSGKCDSLNSQDI